MTLTLLFQFTGVYAGADAPYKDPVELTSADVALVPLVGDVIEDAFGRAHDVVTRVFDYTDDPGPSILLLCEPHREPTVVTP